MRIIHLSTQTEVSSLPPGCVLLLGSFDGVHGGHRALLREAAAMAEPRQAPVCVWTFEYQPKPSQQMGVLTDTDEKCTLLREAGADYALFADFESLRSLDGDTFFREHIAEPHRPSAILCGFNFRYGKGASCTAEHLAASARDAGIACHVIPPFEADGAPLSSSRIRALIAEGDVKTAASLLCHPYSIAAPVEHGKALGHTLGFPTANQRMPRGKLTPKHGVYVVMAQYEDGGALHRTCGVCNIGSRPTVNGDTRDVTLETHLLSGSPDLYGKNLRLYFADRLRDEQPFPDLDALRAQIAEDCRRALALLPEPFFDLP